MFVISDPVEALPEPVSAQSSEDRSREASAGGLDVGECEKRAGEILGVRAHRRAHEAGRGVGLLA